MKTHTLVPTFNCHRFFLMRISVLCLFACLFCGALSAQDTGRITGKVLSQKTGQALVSAQVFLDNRSPAALTETDGSFSFEKIAVGEHTIKVAYTDLDTQTRTVTVTAGQTVGLEFAMASDLYVLDKFVVAAAREGQAAAIQRQRQSNVMVNTVSADAFGNLIDTNAGEFLKNLPGLAIDYAGEDASGFSVRGVGASEGLMTIDGNQFASSDNSIIQVAGTSSGGSRAMDLRNISMASIESVEVYKAPPASQPANANGGIVNMVTREAFTLKNRRIDMSAFLNLNSVALDYASTPGGNAEPNRKWGPGFSFFYSDALLKNRLGISLTLNAYTYYRFNNDLTNNETIVDLTSTDPTTYTKDTPAYPTDTQYKENGTMARKRAASLNIDYKLARNTVLFLKTSYNDNKDQNKYSHYMRTNNGAYVKDESGLDYVTLKDAKLNFSVGGAQTEMAYNEAWSLNPGIKQTIGRLKLDADINYSRSFFKGDRGVSGVSYSAPLASYHLNNVRDSKGMTIIQINPTPSTDYLNLNNYTGLTVNSSEPYTVDKRYGGKFNAKLPVTLLGFPLNLQAGGLYTKWEQDKSNTRKNYLLTNGAGTPGYGEFYDAIFANAWQFTNTIVPYWISPWKVNDYFQANPHMFTLNSTDYNQSLWRYTQGLTEEVIAGYMMGSWQIKNFNATVGVRYEHTMSSASGWQNNSTSAATKYSIVTAENSYDNWFPNVQLKYELTKDLVLRAAYTTSIARPNLQFLKPNNSASVNSLDGKVVFYISNPLLKPQTSKNYDLSVEYYFPHSGILSVSYFYKDMKNYILSSDDYVSGDNPILDGFQDVVAANPTYLYEVRTSRNVGDTSYQGFELSYRQQLRFLPGFLKDFDVSQVFSYTHNTGAVTIAKIKPKVSTTRLTYRAKSWYATVGYQWVSDYLENMPNTKGYVGSSSEPYVEGQNGIYGCPIGRWDMSANYQFSTNWTLSFDWRDFTNAAVNRERFGRQYYYFKGGTAMTVTLKMSL